MPWLPFYNYSIFFVQRKYKKRFYPRKLAHANLEIGISSIRYIRDIPKCM